MKRQSSEWRLEAEKELARLRIERAAAPKRTWVDWLPREYRPSTPTWPTEVLERVKRDEPPPALEVWSKDAVDQFVDDYVRVRKTSESSSPPKKKQKTEILTEEAAFAFHELWKLEFGDWANPFRTRLTKEACDALGMSDYYDKVPTPVDLSLIRDNLRGNLYADDDALRRDIALTPHNPRLYHPKDSPLLNFADELLRTFDDRLRALRGAKEGGATVVSSFSSVSSLSTAPR
mmetsp:Transcript_9481/g.30969  ORF Transcript_9481/g.30969 Transcript_9481/m.30969 type:complete len:233 (-) Transcript_9481:833-1531(-)